MRNRLHSVLRDGPTNQNSDIISVGLRNSSSGREPKEGKSCDVGRSSSRDRFSKYADIAQANVMKNLRTLDGCTCPFLELLKPEDSRQLDRTIAIPIRTRTGLIAGGCSKVTSALALLLRRSHPSGHQRPSPKSPCRVRDESGPGSYYQAWTRTGASGPFQTRLAVTTKED